uniref:Uncharacterized protein n=1 Tax=Strombidium inclinatum TaxID=197538 RepID=A0A7S3ITY3_9SPIT|mmetsp:Transcript_39699/g.60842  ORF Transcript_39699/g.60842 Transcript_39699/m.60842 type:complete len:212 (+) Transcript_39699:15-650(+)
MSERVQTWLLGKTTGLQHLVNEKLAKRSGMIGRFFTTFQMGKREYSAHTFHRAFAVVNYFWMQTFHLYGVMRPIGSRFLGLGNGPLNYSALYGFIFVTAMIVARTKFDKGRDQYTFNAQDGVEFWFERYNMMFPPNYLHTRLSAHYIEINNIFFCEMVKKYMVARKEIIADRERSPVEERMTKYITNPNYIYEPLANEAAAIVEMKHKGDF